MDSQRSQSAPDIKDEIADESVHVNPPPCRQDDKLGSERSVAPAKASFMDIVWLQLRSIFPAAIPTSERSNHGSDIDIDPCKLDEQPKGFPHLAAWMSTNPDFFVARKFQLLHSRLLLYHQSRLRQLESQLFQLDKADEESYPTALIDGIEFDHGIDKDDALYRKKLMLQIHRQLRQYDEILIRTRAMASIPQASSGTYDGLLGYFHSNGLLSWRETRGFMNAQDFIAVPNQSDSDINANLLFHSERDSRRSAGMVVASLAAISSIVLFKDLLSDGEEQGMLHQITLIACLSVCFVVAIEMLTWR